MYIPEIEDVKKAQNKLSKVIKHTPLQQSLNLSEKYQSNIYLKREDLQTVRSYKIRGAYNKLTSLDKKSLDKGVVCASAGNHAQGVAWSCQKLGVKGTIFMPAPTPKQKVHQVEFFGKDAVDIILTGDTFDDAYQAAKIFCDEKDGTFVHPFNDEKVIEGQATVGLELFTDADFTIDYLFAPIGGGGLSVGIASVLHILSPETKIIGVEPEGAAGMTAAVKAGKVVSLGKIDKFADGAAVGRVGELCLPICQKYIKDIAIVNEGKLCSSLISMYNEDGIILEPAGALSVAVLDQYAQQIKGKNVVCVLSGSNNDITRTEEIRERSMLYEGLMHYFIVRFPQRAGALKEFVGDVLGPNDDIIHFEYTKKNSREKGSAVVGIELKSSTDFDALVKRMKDQNFFGEYLNEKPDLLSRMV